MPQEYPQYRRQPFGAKDYTSLQMLGSDIDEATNREMRNRKAELEQNKMLEEKGFVRSTLHSLAGIMSKPDISQEEAHRAIAEHTIKLLGHGGEHAAQTAGLLEKLKPLKSEDYLLGTERVSGPGGMSEEVDRYGHRVGGQDVTTDVKRTVLRPPMSLFEKIALENAKTTGRMSLLGAKKAKISINVPANWDTSGNVTLTRPITGTPEELQTSIHAQMQDAHAQGVQQDSGNWVGYVSSPSQESFKKLSDRGKALARRYMSLAGILDGIRTQSAGAIRTDESTPSSIENLYEPVQE